MRVVKLLESSAKKFEDITSIAFKRMGRNMDNDTMTIGTTMQRRLSNDVISKDRV